MADDTSYNKIQMSTQQGSKNVTFRTDTAEQMLDVSSDFTKHADELLENLTTIEQILMAKSAVAGTIDTGPAQTTSTQSWSPPSGPLPNCPQHGPMKDMRGRRGKTGQPYKKRFYCSDFQCKNSEGDWIE